MNQSRTYIHFITEEAKIASSIFNRLFPSDEQGAGAVDMGVLDYVDHALSGVYQDKQVWYHDGLKALNMNAIQTYQQAFSLCNPEQQDALLLQLEQGQLDNFIIPMQQKFFAMLCQHMREGIFSDPIYGGNRDKAGWRFLKHPGVWFKHSVEEQNGDTSAVKNGEIRSLQDIDLDGYTATMPDLPAHQNKNITEADVILIGMGAVGGVIAPKLTQAGLKVIAFEAGPWRNAKQFLPDELGISFYGRAGLGKKFNAEMPRQRVGEGAQNHEGIFGYGMMVNGVGGSLTHYGAWLRRFHPHHFRLRSYARERWGTQVIPENSTVIDWALNYDDLEPYYTELEYMIGVAGEGDDNPFIPRSKPLPMPALRQFKLGKKFKETTQAMGYHPYMVPVGLNSEAYDGRPATDYNPWSVGFGTLTGDRWDPSLKQIPDAIATGNLDLRTHSRVLRITTNQEGEANGVEYIDASGEHRVQKAKTVILCAYTWENVRLLFLSGDEKHPEGLGNNSSQLGKHFITKTSTHVGAYFEDEIWNRHTGPAAQAMLVDDMMSTAFDPVEHGFFGGASGGVEMQTAPLRISMESRPADVPAWGQVYKDHLRQWQHIAYIGIQQDSLPYTNNYLDLDPHYRDKSGLGLPVIRANYSVQDNEHRISDFMENWCETVFQQMGASKIWRGGRFMGVGSCHELGGTRMADDPAISVVNRHLEVHDTPNLYVFGGSIFPSCPGINPSLTIFATCLHATEHLIDKLSHN